MNSARVGFRARRVVVCVMACSLSGADDRGSRATLRSVRSVRSVRSGDLHYVVRPGGTGTLTGYCGYEPVARVAADDRNPPDACPMRVLTRGCGGGVGAAVRGGDGGGQFGRVR